MGSIKAGIQKYDDILKDMEQMRKAPQKVVDRTVKDFKQRGPGWIAAEVVQKYNIKKNEIVPTKKNNYKPKAGSVKVKGDTIGSMALVYRGRVLTPTHFGMTPKAPKQTYTLKAEFVNGQKKTLGKVKKLTKKQRKNIGKNFTRQGTQNSDRSPIMLMRTGGTYIPFQRVSKRRSDVKAVKTLSMPQMVSNPEVEAKIYDSISKNLGKRFDHYVDRYLKD